MTSPDSPTTPPAQGVASYQVMLDAKGGGAIYHAVFEAKNFNASAFCGALPNGRWVDRSGHDVSCKACCALLSRARPPAGAEGEDERRVARALAQIWRDDAFTKAADIVRRYLGTQGQYIITDILALKSEASALPSAEQAREEEREACAQIVDARAHGWRARLFNPLSEIMMSECEGLARTIRQRKDTSQ